MKELLPRSTAPGTPSGGQQNVIGALELWTVVLLEQVPSGQRVHVIAAVAATWEDGVMLAREDVQRREGVLFQDPLELEVIVVFKGHHAPHKIGDKLL